MSEKQRPINYLYFGAFFSLLICLIASSIFTKESLGGSQVFFFLYALGQVALEVALLIVGSILIRELLGKVCFFLFIGLTFMLGFVHIFDFLMDRILDLSTIEALNVFVFDESLENFFYLLDASGISLWLWVLFFAFLASLPLFGIFLYQLSNRVSLKKPLIFGQNAFLLGVVCIPAALLFWDHSASNVIHPDSYTAFTKSLPWKFTFLRPKTVFYPLVHRLKSPQSEQAIQQAIEEDQTVLAHKPNIYLFVVESLRKSSITEEIAPHLHQFQKTYPQHQTTLSNGNGTHLSWFSIFHSQFPYHWKHFQNKWKMGSPALALLKKLGYKIRLYSSAELSYYQMEELLFGSKSHLIDSRQTFHHKPPATAADTDAAALMKLQYDLLQNPKLASGQVFVIFWDCTHFDYSWPRSWSPKFTPFAQEFAYFRTIQSTKTINAIKNRYNNAVNYMDSLFGAFIQNLPNKEESIVIFTGDHGEEFFEHGHLFHNSHLTQEQTSIPLFFKFGDGKKIMKPRKIASQMDIFPSVIDYLTDSNRPYLEGNSLFQEAKLPYAITARFNAGRTPYEFSIHNGNYKMIAQFTNRENISHSNTLQIISLKTAEDQSVVQKDLGHWIKTEFSPAFEHLFPSGDSQAE